MGAIFISYRREDTEGHAGRLYEDLVERFGKSAVFFDVSAIEPGQDSARPSTPTSHAAACCWP